jgi:hypothetical protein
MQTIITLETVIALVAPKINDFLKTIRFIIAKNAKLKITIETKRIFIFSIVHKF